MLLFNILLTIAFFVVQLSTCNGDDVQYSHKVVSDTKRYDFATSMATAPQRLVIGAPEGNYILPEPGVKVRAPQGSDFGLHLDVNEQFTVVSGSRPDSIYVFSSTHPYTLVARIPLDDYIQDVKVLEENTIIVAVDDDHVLVYRYDHDCSWGKHQEIFLENCQSPLYIRLAVFGDILVVGYDVRYGQVNIYKKVNDQYAITTTLHPPDDDVDSFGWSVAMEGQHLVVSSRNSGDIILFTYELDPSRDKWVMNGRLFVHSPKEFSYVSLKNDILAATVDDPDYNPAVCAYAYKLSKNSHSTNNSNSSVSNGSLFSWKKVATLKTNGMPISNRQYHKAIGVQDGLIFTARRDAGDGYGLVFVHDMNKE